MWSQTVSFACCCHHVNHDRTDHRLGCREGSRNLMFISVSLSGMCPCLNCCSETAAKDWAFAQQQATVVSKSCCVRTCPVTETGPDDTFDNTFPFIKIIVS